MLHWRMESPVAPKQAVAGSVRVSSLHGLIQAMGASVPFSRGSEIYAEGDPAEYVYSVISGAVRLSKITSDGRRQIAAFYLPGDLFGLDAEECHSFSAEAIRDTRVALVSRSALLREAERATDIARQLLAHSVGNVQKAQNHLLLLGRKNAQERIAAFLLEMAQRNRPSGAVELPMSRQDIADYLGLTIETVSRTLTQLNRGGVISIPVSRRIVLKNRPALDDLCESLAA